MLQIQAVRVTPGIHRNFAVGLYSSGGKKPEEKKMPEVPR